MFLCFFLRFYGLQLNLYNVPSSVMSLLFFDVLFCSTNSFLYMFFDSQEESDFLQFENDTETVSITKQGKYSFACFEQIAS